VQVSKRKYILADRSLASGSTLEHVRIAAACGYDAVSLRVAPSPDGRLFVPPRGGSLAAIKRELQEQGIVVWDAESARLNATFSVADFVPRLATAAEVGARYLLTVGDDPDDARVADNFAALARAADLFGITLALEFMVYIGVGSWQRALALLERAGRADAVLLIDALHLQRSGAVPRELAAVNPQRLPYFQLCDAPAKWPQSASELREEARSMRLLPGEGALPLVDLVRTMPMGAAVAVEVPMQRLNAQLGDLEFAQRALNATRAVVEVASGQAA